MIRRDDTHFQFNQKMVLLNAEKTAVLLAKRQGESDYDATFVFTGGKLEVTDEDIIDGLKREKDEELGTDCRVRVCPKLSWNVLFRKADGNSIIVAHFPASFVSGAVVLSDEYSEFQWVELTKLEEFEPKVHNIPEIVHRIIALDATLQKDDWFEI